MGLKGGLLFGEDRVSDVVNDDDDDGNHIEAFEEHVVDECGQAGVVVLGEQQ